LVIALFVLSPVWGGGQGGQTGGTSSQELPPGVKSLDKFTITYFDMNTEPDLSGTGRDSRYYINVEKLYKAMYPNATIEFTGMEAGTTGLDVLQMQLASGTGPDVFEHQTRLAAFAQAGYLYDMSDQPWVKDVIEPVYPDTRYKGKFYGAPMSSGGWGVWYNKKIYEDQLGLKVPNNFQELVDNCEIIKKAGYDPFITGGADGWPFQGVFLTFSSFLFGKNQNFPEDLYNGKASLAGKEMYDLFSAIKLLYDKGYFSQATISSPWTRSLQYVGEGRAVMAFAPAGEMAALEAPDSGYDIQLGYFYIPDWDGYNCVPVLGDSVFSVNAKYQYASTRGVDLVKCLVDDTSLHIQGDGASPVGYKNKPMRHTTMSGQRYQEAYDKGPLVLQVTSWVPSSVFDLYQQIVSSIISGSGFTQAMLDNMQRTYQADKANVNFLTN
jgi:ABC-type glycerol-3-phosphate transport system substrate-binding protein